LLEGVAMSTTALSLSPICYLHHHQGVRAVL